MRKVKTAKAPAPKKKKTEEGELKKTTKLKPMKGKEKKGWKNRLEDDDDDLILEDDLSFSNTFDDDDDDDYGDDYYVDEY